MAGFSVVRRLSVPSEFPHSTASLSGFTVARQLSGPKSGITFGFIGASHTSGMTPAYQQNSEDFIVFTPIIRRGSCIDTGTFCNNKAYYGGAFPCRTPQSVTVVFFRLSPKSVRGCHRTLNETPQPTEGKSHWPRQLLQRQTGTQRSRLSVIILSQALKHVKQMLVSKRAYNPYTKLAQKISNQTQKGNRWQCFSCNHW